MIKHAISSQSKTRQVVTEPMSIGNGGNVRFIMPRVGVVIAIPFMLRFMIDSEEPLRFNHELLEPPDECRDFTIYDFIARLRVDLNHNWRLYDFDGFGTSILNQLHGIHSISTSERVGTVTMITVGTKIPLAIDRPNGGVNAQIIDSTLSLEIDLRPLRELFTNKRATWLSGFAECWSEYLELIIK